MRPLGWILPGLFCVAAVHAAPAPDPACDARYDVDRETILVDPPLNETPRVVAVDGTAVEIEGWCRLDGVRRKAVKHGIRLRRRMKGCGPVRAGMFEAYLLDGCARLRATVRAKHPRRRFFFGAVRRTVPSTLHSIEDRIFSDRGCAVAACHGAARAGNLDLRPGAAYTSLVGVVADNAAARAAGRLRVSPGDAAGSFLSAKIHGTLRPDEGGGMPLGGDPLSPVEIALVDAWIAAGAPETEAVAGAPELPPRVYEETPPLAPPPGGYQVVLDGPVLQPGQEEEGCLWVPAPIQSDVPIRKVEVALNPGTHHFAVWAHDGDAPPPLGTWLANDIACLGSGASLGRGITGAANAPYVVAEQPPGFAGILPGGTYYGLNAHYYNESSAPIRIRAWVNFHPYEGTPTHLVKGIPIALDASYAINVPPFARRTVQGRFTNTSDRTMRVMGLGGHMHKRGVRFSIWLSDGTKVLDDYDWAHPTVAGFTPPHALAPGDWIEFECLHDNGVSRPVRRDDRGQPRTIAFGISAEDEMCILTGQYYDD
jgi:hypothetical protein